MMSVAGLQVFYFVAAAKRVWPSSVSADDLVSISVSRSVPQVSPWNVERPARSAAMQMTSRPRRLAVGVAAMTSRPSSALVPNSRSTHTCRIVRPPMPTMAQRSSFPLRNYDWIPLGLRRMEGRRLQRLRAVSTMPASVRRNSATVSTMTLQRHHHHHNCPLIPSPSTLPTRPSLPSPRRNSTPMMDRYRCPRRCPRRQSSSFKSVHNPISFNICSGCGREPTKRWHEGHFVTRHWKISLI